MSRRLTTLIALGIALIAAVVAIVLIGWSTDDEHAPDQANHEPSVTAPPVVSDDAWCAGWDTLVSLQGQWVAAPTPDSSSALLAAVDDLQGLGVPESLDPAGYTELTAVLDDVRASVDPSFTPSIEPSEPADVSSTDTGEAPFGAWLAGYCAT
jgi:hypothetical protein